MSGSCGCGCGGHDERHAPKVLYTAPGRTALDYRVGDYGSFRAAMLDRLASPAYPALRGLTVRTPDDPSIGLLDAWAAVRRYPSSAMRSEWKVSRSPTTAHASTSPMDGSSGVRTVSPRSAG